MGIPYAWGSSNPAVGFDCSGFTRYVYAQLGVSLPHSAAAQQASVTPVSNPQPGDLVFFGYPAWHVGIYAGNGMIYQATNPGSVSNYMAISSIYGSVSGYGRP
jgi:cell wall-associated NlpC family hydrolase